MSWSYVQQTSVKGPNSTSQTTSAITTTAGNFVVVGLVYYRTTSSSLTPTLSDSQSNTWTDCGHLTYSVAGQTSNVLTVGIKACQIVNAGSTTFTGGYSVDGNGNPQITVLVAEYGTGGQTVTFGSNTSGTAGSTATTITPSGLATTGNDLVVTVLNPNGYTTYTPASGFTTRVQQDTGSVNQYGVTADWLNAPAGTYTGSWTMGVAGGGAVVQAAFSLPLAAAGGAALLPAMRRRESGLFVPEGFDVGIRPPRRRGLVS